MYVFLSIRDDAGAETLLGEMAFQSIEEAYLDVCGAIPGAIADELRRGRDPLQFSYLLTSERGELLFEVPFAEPMMLQVRPLDRPRPRADLPGGRVSALASELERSRRVCARSRMLHMRARAAVHDSFVLLQKCGKRRPWPKRGATR